MMKNDKSDLDENKILSEADDSIEEAEPEIFEPEEDEGIDASTDLDDDDEDETRPPVPADVFGGGPLQLYMSEISRYNLLTREEEVSLSKKYLEEGDLNAAYKLVVSNLRLVVKIAYDFRRGFVNLMDLIQEGNIGLMKAVEKFDPYRGVKLSSYASWWIRAYMIRYLLNNWSLVKIGTTQNQRRLFFNLKKAKRELDEQGFNPQPKLLAAKLNVKEEEIIEMEQRLSGMDVSLDAPLDDDSDASRMSFIADNGVNVSDKLEYFEFRELVRTKLDEFREKLNKRDKIIFDRRLVAEDPITLRELGEDFGVSRERVRQIESQLKQRLHDFLKLSKDVVDAYEK